MKIITVNLPVPYLKAIEKLVGENGLYPSRSELIRVAIRDFLVHEIDTCQVPMPVKPPTNITATNRPPEIDPNLFVQVPVSHPNEISTSAFKTYRIIKK